jgi:hypothetical protein
MVFAIAPQKLSIILILGIVIIGGGLVAQLVATGAHRTALGAVEIAVLVVVALASSMWIWDNVSKVDAVNVILVILSLALGLGLALKVARAEAIPPPAAIAIAIAIAAAGIVLAAQFVFGGITIDEVTASEVVVMMFGLGAIVLAREPRGVVYDIVNRQRLRQMHDAERRDEEKILAAGIEEATVMS